MGTHRVPVYNARRSNDIYTYPICIHIISYQQVAHPQPLLIAHSTELLLHHGNCMCIHDSQDIYANCNTVSHIDNQSLLALAFSYNTHGCSVLYLCSM